MAPSPQVLVFVVANLALMVLSALRLGTSLVQRGRSGAGLVQDSTAGWAAALSLLVVGAAVLAFLAWFRAAFRLAGLEERSSLGLATFMWFVPLVGVTVPFIWVRRISLQLTGRPRTGLVVAWSAALCVMFALNNPDPGLGSYWWVTPPGVGRAAMELTAEVLALTFVLQVARAAQTRQPGVRGGSLS